MPLIARASTTVRNKNILILLMCAGFLSWFAYDAWVRYPRDNDRLVTVMKSYVEGNRLSATNLPQLEAWTGWAHEDSQSRANMTTLAQNEAKIENWRSETDINTQKYIVIALALAVIAAIWWFFHCQARRAIADELSISPAKGVVIPWDKIIRINNTRWKSTGIVEITYLDAAGKEQSAKFDDYEIEREPLLEILDQMADKATRAEIIPKDDPADPTASIEDANEA